jgi:hypothetical protein
MTSFQSLVRGYLTSAGFRILEQRGDSLSSLSLQIIEAANISLSVENEQP